jgi:hypothetical protein
MIDLQKWNLAKAQLHGFAKHLPSGPSEDDVAHYHSIVDALEKTSGYDLSAFRVIPSRMQRRMKQLGIATDWSGRGGHTSYTEKKYCDTAYLRGLVEGLEHFVKSVREESPHSGSGGNEELYRSMITALAGDRGIKPKRVTDASGDRWVRDRDHFIGRCACLRSHKAHRHIRAAFEVMAWISKV